MWGLLILLGVALALLVVLGTAGLSWLLVRPPRLTLGRAMAMGLPTEPGEAGLAGGSATFTVTRGVTVPAFVVEGGRPGGPTVLMFHGLLESRYASLARAERLAEHAGRLILPDLRAHGEASRSLCYGGTIEVDDALAILEQADGGGTADAPAPLVLHGFSMGAGAAIATGGRLSELAADGRGDAPRNPDLARWRLAGVIAEASYRHWTTPLWKFLWFYRVPPWPFVPLLRLIHEPINPALRRYDRAADAAKITAPLRLLHGSADWLCEPRHAHEIADAAADGVCMEMPGATHMDVATKDEARYRAALAEAFGAFESGRG